MTSRWITVCVLNDYHNIQDWVWSVERHPFVFGYRICLVTGFHPPTKKKLIPLWLFIFIFLSHHSFFIQQPPLSFLPTPSHLPPRPLSLNFCISSQMTNDEQQTMMTKPIIGVTVHLSTKQVIVSKSETMKMGLGELLKLIIRHI